MLDLVSPHVVGQSPTSLAAFHRYRHESGLGKVFLYGRKMRWQVLRPLAVFFWTPEDKDIVIHDLVQCPGSQVYPGSRDVKDPAVLAWAVFPGGRVVVVESIKTFVPLILRDPTWVSPACA